MFFCVAGRGVSSVEGCGCGRRAPWMTSSSIWRRYPPCSGGRWSFSTGEDFFFEGSLRGAMPIHCSCSVWVVVKW